MVFPSYPPLAPAPAPRRRSPIALALVLALAVLAAALLFERSELSRRSEALAGAAAWNSFALELGDVQAGMRRLGGSLEAMGGALEALEARAGTPFASGNERD